jgi:DNA repair protein RAD51
MICTSIKKLDHFLNGGIKNGIILDIFGANATGKTQLAMQICVNALQEGRRILFQDTTGEFRPERILEIMKFQDMDSDLLDKITVGRVTNTSEQIQYLSKIKIENFSLIVIDNITDLFSFEYSSDKNFLEKNILFMNYMHDLSLIALHYKIPIVMTNMIRQKDDLDVENLDKSISIFTHMKIKLRKNGNRYVGEVIPSFLKKQEFSYLITARGITDVS